jgi:hypothetical protein
MALEGKFTHQIAKISVLTYLKKIIQNQRRLPSQMPGTDVLKL